MLLLILYGIPREPSKWWPRFRKVLVLSYDPRALQLSEFMATPRGPTEVRFKHVPGPGLGAGILDGHGGDMAYGIDWAYDWGILNGYIFFIMIYLWYTTNPIELGGP